MFCRWPWSVIGSAGPPPLLLGAAEAREADLALCHHRLVLAAAAEQPRTPGLRHCNAASRAARQNRCAAETLLAARLRLTANEQ